MSKENFTSEEGALPERTKPQANNNDVRNRARDRSAFNLAKQGHTTRQIANVLGIKPEQVKGCVQRGARQ